MHNYTPTKVQGHQVLCQRRTASGKLSGLTRRKERGEGEGEGERKRKWGERTGEWARLRGGGEKAQRCVCMDTCIHI